MSADPDPLPRICLECGAANRPDALRCVRCLTQLRGHVERRPLGPPPGRRARPMLFWPRFLFVLVLAIGLAVLVAWLTDTHPALVGACLVVTLPIVLASAALAASWTDRTAKESTRTWLRRFWVTFLAVLPAAFALVVLLVVAICGLLFAICTAAIR